MGLRARPEGPVKPLTTFQFMHNITLFCKIFKRFNINFICNVHIDMHASPRFTLFNRSRRRRFNASELRFYRADAKRAHS